MSFLMLILVAIMPYNADSMKRQGANTPDPQYSKLPIRSGSRPKTTPTIPHVQIGVRRIEKVHEEMVKRIYAIPGIVSHPSVVLSWQGITLSEDVKIKVPEALIGGREFGHIHDDGSLHIFLAPDRANEAVEAGWAVHHPYAVQNRKGWSGFVMLYTPQSLNELETTLQLVVDSYNYITGSNFQPMK
ncbi:MAG: luciferase family protein [Bacteroidota bacterium]